MSKEALLNALSYVPEKLERDLAQSDMKFDMDKLYHDLENAKSFNARMFYHNARFLYYFQIAEWEKCLEHMQAQVFSDSQRRARLCPF